MEQETSQKGETLLPKIGHLLNKGQVNEAEMYLVFPLLIEYLKESIEEASVLMGSYYAHLNLSQWTKNNLSRKRSGSLLNPSLTSIDSVFSEGLPYTSRVAFRDELDFLLVEVLHRKLNNPSTVFSYWLEEGISLESDLHVLREAHQNHIALVEGLKKRETTSANKIAEAAPLLEISNKFLELEDDYTKRRKYLVERSAQGLQHFIENKNRR